MFKCENGLKLGIEITLIQEPFFQASGLEGLKAVTVYVVAGNELLRVVSDVGR